MSSPVQPTSLAALAAAVRSAPRVIAVGAGTKPRLSAAEGLRISTTRLSGLVEYEPDEFTFTALAGTPLREIATALASCGQHLPFDPPMVAAGATLGGTVAAGLSGPGRVRFGGLRDFILGVRFVDGLGRLLHLGGKVVKNAAGFDVPKFLCGSLGRFGVLGEITFKVFPRPPALRTLRLRADGPGERLRIFRALGRSRWEPVAVEGVPGSHDVWVQLGGAAAALDAMAQDILGQFPGVREIEGADLLDGLREFTWAPPDAILVKVPVTPGDTVPLSPALDAIPGVRHQVGAAGAVVWMALEHFGAVSAVRAVLERHGLDGLTLRGDAPLWWSSLPRPAVESAVRLALDPAHRFPDLGS
ncbi:MAG: FAD-binding protein [Verrucomicrobia bacterium]|nr:FAD-binding protein [Verrucomicrobiota bacterium]